MGHTKIILWPTQIVSSGPQVARGPQVADPWLKATTSRLLV